MEFLLLRKAGAALHFIPSPRYRLERGFVRQWLAWKVRKAIGGLRAGVPLTARPQIRERRGHNHPATTARLRGFAWSEKARPRLHSGTPARLIRRLRVSVRWEKDPYPSGPLTIRHPRPHVFSIPRSRAARSHTQGLPWRICPPDALRASVDVLLARWSHRRRYWCTTRLS